MYRLKHYTEKLNGQVLLSSLRDRKLMSNLSMLYLKLTASANLCQERNISVGAFKIKPVFPDSISSGKGDRQSEVGSLNSTLLCRAVPSSGKLTLH